MSELRRIDKCRSCQAPIIWVQTSAGRAMPVDAEPVANGNVLLMPIADRRWLGVVVGKEAALQAAPSERFISHFASCPDGPTFRKPRKGGTK